MNESAPTGAPATVLPPAPPRQKHTAFFIAIAAICAIALIAAGYFLYKEFRSRSFFSDALQKAQVSHGSSLGEMQLAYARELARRNPILGVEGADMDRFSTTIERLSHTERSLIDIQTSEEDRSLAGVLYPLEFLRALFDAETARRAFIASGSDTDARSYKEALARAIDAGQKDASNFSTALNATLGDASIQIPTLGYAITSDRMIQSARDTNAYMRALGAEQARRDACVSGDLGSCRPDDLALPTLPTPGAMSSAGLSPLSKDAYSLIAGHSYDEKPASERTVALTKSACTAGTDAPFYFVYRPDMTDPIGRYLYVGDLYFTPTDLPQSVTLAYLRDSLGISYSRLNPMTFYSCPEVGYDIGAIRAVVATADFAAAHHDLAPESAAALAGPILSEDDAIRYVSAAISRTQDATARNSLISLALQLSRRSGGLPEVIDEVATVEDTDIGFVRAGVPFTVRARDLIVGHTAFPSLFMTLFTPWSGSITSLRLVDAQLLELFLSRQKSYSSLRESVPRSKLEHDIAAFFDFENIAR